MQIVFYLCGLIAVLATLRVITHTQPVYALLYLIVSLLAIAGVFFTLGQNFAGALEIIVYAGAIMVLFVFIVMMLNLGKAVTDQEYAWLKPGYWIGPGFLSLILLALMVYAVSGLTQRGIEGHMIDAKAVGVSLLGPYVLIVELASMLLLSGVVVAYHLGREQRTTNAQGDLSASRRKAITEEEPR